MFLAWALMLLHAALRPSGRAWVEQFCIAAAAFLLLPVLNALTTNRHLGTSLPAGDWVFAGFDLAMLAFGLAFAGCAWWISRPRGVTIAGAAKQQRDRPAAATELARASLGKQS